MNIKGILTGLALLVFGAFANAYIEVQMVTNEPALPNQTVESVQTIETMQRLSYYFGIVDINSYNTARWTITNRGTTPINYLSSYISGIDFRASHSCYGVLNPNQQCDFTITYWPAFEGYDSGWFEISFSENNVITVDVWGEARRRW